MRDDYQKKIADKIAARYIDLELRIMEDIVRRIKKTGEITSTADWQINRLKILGYSSEDIENAIKDTLNASYPEMFELYDKIVEREYVRDKDVYEQVNAQYMPYEENEQMQQNVEAIIRQSKGELENITGSLGFYLDYNGRKVLTPLAEVYSGYLDTACYEIVSGAFDYGSVLRRTVTQLTTDQQEKAQERLNKAKAAAAKEKKEAPTSDINAPVNVDWRKAEEQVRSAQATLDKADANVQKYKDSLNSLDVELDKAANKQISETNYATFLQDLDKLAKDAGVKAKNIPASVENGIKEGVYVNPTTGKELKNLIKLDDLMTSDDFTKMQEEGKQIPQYLSKGISEGTISFETATKKIQNALNWTDLVQKAKDGGKKIPDGIVQGIQSGEYAVPTSMKELNNLVKFDSLKAKADKAGVQIPDSLANAIMAGSMKPKEAAESISTMIKFTDAVQKAGIDGSEIPQELAEKVLSGRTSVNAAIKQLQDGIAKESDKAAKKTSKAKKDPQREKQLALMMDLC